MIIAFSGYKGSGKSTAADFLRNDCDFKKYTLSSPMKEACKAIFMWDDTWVDGPKKEIIDMRWGISPRRAMQLLGTEFGQFVLCEHDKNFKNITGRKLWINRFKYWWFAQGCPSTVIDDVRFIHEWEVLKELKAWFIFVERFNPIEWTDKHASELYYRDLKYHFIVDNKDTMKSLGNAVYLALDSFRKMKWSEPGIKIEKE